MTTPGKVFKPYPFQRAALKSRARFTVLLGGTGSGKTFLTPIWHAMRIAADVEAGVAKDAKYLALGPTAEMVRDMLVPTFERAFQGTALEGEYAKQAAIYSLPTGGQILFRSADEPLRIEGHHVRAMSVDEPSQMKALIWTIIQARTALYQAPVLFTGYPTNMGWYYHDVYRRWEAGDNDFNVLQFSSLENPDYPRDEFEKARQRMPEWMFEMRYLGKFRKPFGLVYPAFGAACFCDPFAVPVGWPVYVAVDPGVFCGALVATWQDGTYYIVGERYTETVTTAAEHVSALGAIIGQRRVVAWIFDPSRATDAAEFQAQGVGPIVGAANAVLPGIATVTGFIQTGRLKVFRGSCPNLVDQMEKYSFPTDPMTGMVSKENPIKRDDHLCLKRGTMVTTAAGDVPIESVTPGMVVVTRDGFAEVDACGMTGKDVAVMEVQMSDGRTLTATPEHPVWVDGAGWKSVDAVRYGILASCEANRLSSTALSSEGTQDQADDQTRCTSRQGMQIRQKVSGVCTKRSGRSTTGLYLKAIASITQTETQATTPSKTCGACELESIPACTVARNRTERRRVRTSIRPSPQPRHGISRVLAWNGTHSTGEMSGVIGSPSRGCASSVAACTARGTEGLASSARMRARRLRESLLAWTTWRGSVRFADVDSPSTSTARRGHAPVSVEAVAVGGTADVYGLQTKNGRPEFFANGVLVHNCDCLRYLLQTLEGAKPEQRTSEVVVYEDDRPISRY